MCNLAGWVGKIKKEEVINTLREIEEFNKDATGVGIKTGNLLRIFKTALPAGEYVKLDSWNDWIEKHLPVAEVGLLHCRKATNGSPLVNVNNHPHYSKEYGTMLVHRGIVKAKYKYPTVSECDSEHILNSLNHLGLKRGIKNLTGWATIAYLKGNILWLYSNSGNLYLTHNNGTILFTGRFKAKGFSVPQDQWVGIKLDSKQIVYGPKVELKLTQIPTWIYTTTSTGMEKVSLENDRLWQSFKKQSNFGF